MKMMKKVLALSTAAAMLFGMSVTAFAATPTEGDATTATVINVEYDATVMAYQIVEADYNTSGFIGYSDVEEVDTMIANTLAPTANELAAIAKSDQLVELTAKEMTLKKSIIYIALFIISAVFSILAVEGVREVALGIMIALIVTYYNSQFILPSLWATIFKTKKKKNNK